MIGSIVATPSKSFIMEHIIMNITKRKEPKMISYHRKMPNWIKNNYLPIKKYPVSLMKAPVNINDKLIRNRIAKIVVAAKFEVLAISFRLTALLIVCFKGILLLELCSDEYLHTCRCANGLVVKGLKMEVIKCRCFMIVPSWNRIEYLKHIEFRG